MLLSESLLCIISPKLYYPDVFISIDFFLLNISMGEDYLTEPRLD